MTFKMPNPERLYTLTNRDGDPQHIMGYTSDLLKKSLRDVLEQVAAECDNQADGYYLPRYELPHKAATNCATAIRAMIGEIK